MCDLKTSLTCNTKSASQFWETKMHPSSWFTCQGAGLYISLMLRKIALVRVLVRKGSTGNVQGGGGLQLYSEFVCVLGTSVKRSDDLCC